MPAYKRNKKKLKIFWGPWKNKCLRSRRYQNIFTLNGIKNVGNIKNILIEYIEPCPWSGNARDQKCVFLICFKFKFIFECRNQKATKVYEKF